MDKLATMGTIGSSFRPRLSYYGICLLNRPQTGATDSVQPVILRPVQRDSQEIFIPCEARMLWYSADRTSSQQLRDTTNSFMGFTPSCPIRSCTCPMRINIAGSPIDRHRGTKA